jgi:hypothetical protein
MVLIYLDLSPINAFMLPIRGLPLGLRKYAQNRPRKTFGMQCKGRLMYTNIECCSCDIHQHHALALSLHTLILRKSSNRTLTPRRVAPTWPSDPPITTGHCLKRYGTNT